MINNGKNNNNNNNNTDHHNCLHPRHSGSLQCHHTLVQEKCRRNHYHHHILCDLVRMREICLMLVGGGWMVGVKDREKKKKIGEWLVRRRGWKDN